jgi:hypothetical protein
MQSAHESTHIYGTHAPVEEPSTASRPAMAPFRVLAKVI